MPQGWINSPRLNYACGDLEVKEHRYSGTKVPVREWLPRHKAIRDRIYNESGVLFNACLDNLYRDGRDSIYPHGDKEAMGPGNLVVTVSIGAARTFTLKHNITGVQISTTLYSGDMVIMAGQTQKEYVHSIPKEPQIKDARASLTFRCLKR